MAIEQVRALLIVALVVVGFFLWEAWQRDYGPQAPPPSERAAGESAAGGAGAGTRAGDDPATAPPAADVPDAPDARPGEPAASPAPADAPAAPAEPPADFVEVRTDVLRAWIDPRGGTLARVDLLDYPVDVDRPDEPFTLLSPAGNDAFIAQTGLIGEEAAPNHHARFEPERRRYELAAGEDAITVPLTWTSPEGVTVTKRYVFGRDRYLVDVSMQVENAGSAPWQARMYGQFTRADPGSPGGIFRTYTYTGGVVSGPEKPYEKFDFDDMADQDLARTVRGGWAAMIQHYFAGAWVPDQDSDNYYYTKSLGESRYVIGVVAPGRTIAPGSTGELGLRLYVGPKIQDRLNPIAPHLERTVDYGWLWLIAEPLFWLLSWIHGFVGNWGWSIILLTCLIKLAFFQLSAASYKSMARMRKLQPRVQALRERYTNDRAAMNQKMMELYKEEKINPLGGCFPILVQIPVFIALYWVLLESVELRQASFMFWLNDLSEHDPYFVLPVAMGATMFIQQKLNPAPPDPMQAKIMMMLPFVFTFFFLFFPSGLVLYWLVNNVLSIIQQWVITKKIVGER